MSNYVTDTALKATLSLTGYTFADADVTAANSAASRAIDSLCQRRFWEDASDVTRYYTADKTTLLEIDDLVSFTSLATDDDGTFGYANSWTQNTDFVFEPLNAPTESPAQPWTHIRVLPQGSFQFNTFYPRSVKLVGKFGWAAVPDDIVQATTILAARLLRLAREAPFGVVGFDGGAIRIARMDSNVMMLLGPYMKHRISVG